MSSKILCIDFGTSSLRAAISQDGLIRPKPLELGEAFRSSIDRASIPSAIFIDKNGSQISFGEEALTKGQRGDASYLFEISPKKWMTESLPETLNTEMIKGSGISRRHLLAGLFAQGFSAIRTATGLSESELAKLEIRVAHPVWTPNAKKSLLENLTWITEVGLQLAGITDKTLGPDKLLTAVRNASVRSKTNIHDVEEPVAAALELFENSENSREICVVIDVGAGTTDIGIFVSLTPDRPGYRRKFFQAAPPRSIHMAGDLIDEEVLSLIKSRSKNIRSDVLQDLDRRRRNIKETLFSNAGKVFEAGIEVSIRDLVAQKRIRQMRNEITLHFESLINEAASYIRPFVEASFFRANTIDIIFAGGGGNIRFLHDAIGRFACLPNGPSIPVVIRSAKTVDQSLPAAIERLAVAMGGTTPLNYWPVTRT